MLPQETRHGKAQHAAAALHMQSSSETPRRGAVQASVPRKPASAAFRAQQGWPCDIKGNNSTLQLDAAASCCLQVTWHMLPALAACQLTVAASASREGWTRQGPPACRTVLTLRRCIASKYCLQYAREAFMAQQGWPCNVSCGPGTRQRDAAASYSPSVAWHTPPVTAACTVAGAASASSRARHGKAQHAAAAGPCTCRTVLTPKRCSGGKCRLHICCRSFWGTVGGTAGAQQGWPCDIKANNSTPPLDAAASYRPCVAWSTLPALAACQLTGAASASTRGWTRQGHQHAEKC